MTRPGVLSLQEALLVGLENKYDKLLRSKIFLACLPRLQGLSLVLQLLYAILERCPLEDLLVKPLYRHIDGCYLSGFMKRCCQHASCRSLQQTPHSAASSEGHTLTQEAEHLLVLQATAAEPGCHEDSLVGERSNPWLAESSDAFTRTRALQGS